MNMYHQSFLANMPLLQVTSFRKFQKRVSECCEQHLHHCIRVNLSEATHLEKAVVVWMNVISLSCKIIYIMPNIFTDSYSVIGSVLRTCSILFLW